MDKEALVREITRNVLERLRGESGRSRVLILAERDESLAATVRERLGEDAEFLFFGEASDRAPDRCVLPRLCCSDMADLALGRASNPCLVEALRLFLSGVKVEVLEFGHRAFADTAPAALYALYESYEKTLASYGVTELKPKRPGTLRLRETLVTEKDVLRARESGASRLLLPAGAKVTPLAADTARDLKIVLEKE